MGPQTGAFSTPGSETVSAETATGVEVTGEAVIDPADPQRRRRCSRWPPALYRGLGRACPAFLGAWPSALADFYPGRHPDHPRHRRRRSARTPGLPDPGGPRGQLLLAGSPRPDRHHPPPPAAYRRRPPPPPRRPRGPGWRLPTDTSRNVRATARRAERWLLR
ncbi:hypothetical protein ACRAWF_27605 [Streptomyces sp. L7]